MTNKKMSLKPNLNKISKEDFINEPKKIKDTFSNEYPWEKENVSDRVILPFNIRFPESLKLKIQWIVKNSLEYDSYHDFCMTAIKQKVDESIKHLTK